MGHAAFEFLLGLQRRTYADKYSINVFNVLQICAHVCKELKVTEDAYILISSTNRIYAVRISQTRLDGISFSRFSDIVMTKTKVKSYV